MHKNPVLLTFPTPAECMPLLSLFSPSAEGYFIHKDFPDIHLLISGAGIPKACLTFGRYYEEIYDAVIQMGIAGSLSDDFPAGTLVRVVHDHYADLGAQDGENFLDAAELNLDIQTSYEEKVLPPLPSCLLSLPCVKGVTVNTVHGYEPDIEKLRNRFPDAVTETMEGCAFFHANSHRKWIMQLRCISNKVERRNKDRWNIPLAVQCLNEFALNLIYELSR